jgi:hypothetical protein
MFDDETCRANYSIIAGQYFKPGAGNFTYYPDRAVVWTTFNEVPVGFGGEEVFLAVLEHYPGSGQY